MNVDEDRRCRRCGRALYDTRETTYAAAATSGNLARLPESVPRISLPAPPSLKPASVPRQAMLFQDRRPGNVIPLDGIYDPPQKPKTVTRTSTRMTRRPGAPDEAQPAFEFAPPPPPRKLSTTVEAKIVCDAPVASLMHRACAAAIDGSMILIACGAFFAVFGVLGGSFAPTKTVLLIMAAAALLIAMFYGFVWVCAGGRTLGMRALHLSLINFDGFPPDRPARWLRYLGACLGFCAGGLGLFWALLDEESLAWHDHISKTFPTFQGPETSFVHRP